MKKIFFWIVLFVSLIPLAYTQGNRSQSGSMVIDFVDMGLGHQFDGNYAFIRSGAGAELEIYGYQSGVFPANIQLVQIIDGRAIIPVYRAGGAPYNGNDTLSIVLYVFNKNRINVSEASGLPAGSLLFVIVCLDVEFRNGRTIIDNRTSRGVPG